jgi:hypothetical protein
MAVENETESLLMYYTNNSSVVIVYKVNIRSLMITLTFKRYTEETQKQ